MPEFLYTIVAFFFRPACSQQQQQQQVCHKIFIDKTPSCCCCCWVFFGPKANQARPKKRKLVATLQSAIHKLVCGQCTTQRCAVKNWEWKKREATLSRLSLATLAMHDEQMRCRHTKREGKLSLSLHLLVWHTPCNLYIHMYVCYSHVSCRLLLINATTASAVWLCLLVPAWWHLSAQRPTNYIIHKQSAYVHI